MIEVAKRVPMLLPVLMAAVGANPQDGSGNWVARLASSPQTQASPFKTRVAKRAKADVPMAAAERSSGPSKGVDPSGPITWNPTPQTLEHMLAIQRGAEAVEAEVDVCKALITAGKFAAARRRLEDDIQRDPQTMYAGPLIVLVLDHGQYKDAYRLAGWMFRAGVDDHTVRLGAALAAAEAGSIYPGQHEYVMDSVAGRYALPSMLKCLPTGHSRQEELFLAALALGEDTSRMGSEANAIPFLELAGRIDPNNPEVCRYLAVDYAATGFRYTLALATLRRALPRAEGYDRGVIECYEKTFQHNLATVGEGNPVPPDPRGSYLTSNPGALDLSTHKPHTSPRP